jgi:3-methyladenine DNA glycosylase/8-oxoguanine DNA glycosylase
LIADARLVWRPVGLLDIRATLAPLRRGGTDPSFVRAADGALWLARRTPEGPGTIVLRRSSDADVVVDGWGPGAQWLVAAVPAMLGVGDDWTDLDVTSHPLLAQVRRNHPGLRLPRTGLVLDSLVPAILEQRVTGMEARRSWRGLLAWHGEVAPGPTPTPMRVMPDPRTLLAVPTWDWHRLGVELARQRPIRAAATVAARLEEIVSMEPHAAIARLRSLPGIGVWTAAETVQRALGHPDEVSVGDDHLHDTVVHALTGRARGDDAEMLELLEPWRGHRQRVVRLIELSGVAKPKFGPRYAPIDFRRH